MFRGEHVQTYSAGLTPIFVRCNFVNFVRCQFRQVQFRTSVAVYHRGCIPLFAARLCSSSKPWPPLEPQSRLEPPLEPQTPLEPTMEPQSRLEAPMRPQSRMSLWERLKM